MNRIVFVLFLLGTGIISCKKGDSKESGTISIYNLSQDRQKTSSTFKFQVLLDKAVNAEVSFDYTTVEGNAKANTDFIPKSGTVTIPANSTEAFIEITVTGDSLRRESQLFYVQLSKAVNGSFVKDKATGTIVNENLLYYPVSNTGYSTPTTYPGYTLVWQDEFDGTAVNSNFWTFEQGNNNGWGNNELQNYTNRTENAFVSNGNLIIEARSERYGNSNYTSARMITKDKKTFTFGRVDIRAKMPKGQGIWPALWMLGNNIDVVSWPACGEIDIMEYLGHETNKVHATCHWGNSFATRASKTTSRILTTGGFNDEFHVYSMIWTQDSIKIYVDDVLSLSLAKTEVNQNYPFNSPFFFIFNIAVGGNWPGVPDSSTTFPQRMIVDYIRVFQ
ncbi:MAG: family 16 glycosylhydrolase [Chitinophagaceae bacterium]|nr:family 16 glycosylhydrolase [Chitinophagaceae bacterium]